MANLIAGSLKELDRVSNLLDKNVPSYRKLPWKKFLTDHSINIYRKKLMSVAEKRNKIKQV